MVGERNDDDDDDDDDDDVSNNVEEQQIANWLWVKFSTVHSLCWARSVCKLILSFIFVHFVSFVNLLNLFIYDVCFSAA
jgi:hypothetical protein